LSRWDWSRKISQYSRNLFWLARDVNILDEISTLIFLHQCVLVVLGLAEIISGLVKGGFRGTDNLAGEMSDMGKRTWTCLSGTRNLSDGRWTSLGWVTCLVLSGNSSKSGGVFISLQLPIVSAPSRLTVGAHHVGVIPVENREY
jgi:hypothetical protein